jgi:hypothetical protein
MAIPEHAVVPTLVPKIDDRGRAVPVGSKGTVVHVFPVRNGETPAYVIEVVLLGADGMHNDAHIFDAFGSRAIPVGSLYASANTRAARIRRPRSSFLCMEPREAIGRRLNDTTERGRYVRIGSELVRRLLDGRLT